MCHTEAELRERLQNALNDAIKTALQPGWYGHIGISVAVQNGRVVHIKRTVEQNQAVDN